MTYSLSSTSTVEARSMRLTYGMTARTSVATGRTNNPICPASGARESTFETDGSHLNTAVANSSTSTMPITNSGSAARARLPRLTALSKRESRQMALIAPMTMEIGMLIRAAKNTRVAELTMRLWSSVVTFSPPPTSDVPKSPVTTSPSQDVYWVTTGRSRPSSLRSAS